jgi:hypothetical protein
MVFWGCIQEEIYREKRYSDLFVVGSHYLHHAQTQTKAKTTLDPCRKIHHFQKCKPSFWQITLIDIWCQGEIAQGFFFCWVRARGKHHESKIFHCRGASFSQVHIWLLYAYIINQKITRVWIKVKELPNIGFNTWR